MRWAFATGAGGADAVQRVDRLDALRGLAIVWMAGFHFCFDLNLYGLLSPPQSFQRDVFWTLQRSLIVSLFLLCAGIGQALALEMGQTPARFWRRWRQVAGCALLVSIGSAWMFPRSWISFGVLHGVAVMLLLVRGLAQVLPRSGGYGAVWLGLAGLAWALPRWVQHPFFDSRWTNGLGLVSRLPRTEDYVPVLPWLAVVLAGVVLGSWLWRHHRSVLAGPLPPGLHGLAVLGRWSLSFYMLHQPVFLAGLWGWLWLHGR